MRPTKTIAGIKAREAIKNGVNAIYEPVRVTFGPEGKNALLYRTMNRGNRITNDGVTVAKCQEPKDQFIRMAAETFKEACIRTAEKVGDGTTGTTIIGGKLFNEVFKQLDETQNPFSPKGNKKGVMSLKREILAEAEKVKEAIKASAKKVETLEELEKIATISVENEKLGKIIAKMAWDTGVDGFIDVVEGYKGEIETETIKGMRFPAKVASKAFVNNPDRYEMVVTDCPVLVTNYAFDSVNDVVQTFEGIFQKNGKVAVIAPSYSENTLVAFANAIKTGYFIYPVLAPALRTEQLEDLAIYCGATFIDKAKGKKLQNITEADLGFVERMVIKDSENKEEAVATGGRGKGVEERVAILKGQLAETKHEQFKMLMQRRIASMASAVGIIRVGGSTQAESLYLKLKIEDAVFACKAALRGGYVKGAGLCLKEIADTLEDTNIIKQAILAPYEQIQNSVDGGVAITENVIDPAEAIYYAVEHASQVVANLITVDSITCELEDPSPEDGNFAIAKVLTEWVINDKKHKGQLKEGQEEVYRDSLGGMNEWEYEKVHTD